MSNKLPFYRGDRLVGYLTGEKETLNFEYAADWNGEPISPLLPINGKFEQKNVQIWFKEMLPDERRRRTFETLTKLSLERIKEFLSWYGEDLPGDLSIRPASEPSDPKDITKILENMLIIGESIDMAAFKLSLAGGEPKTAVIVKKDKNGVLKYFAPSSSRPSTHIIKASKTLSYMEEHTMSLARETGLFPVSEMNPVSLAGVPVLLIKRFDRKIKNGINKRLMVEDFCQATGLSGKYGKDENGVELEHMRNIFAERLSDDDIDNFIKMSLFSMIVGNGDDHAGNYATIKDKDWKLAPAYDIISSASVKKMAESGIDFVSPMYIMLDLEQSRKFGVHRDPRMIDGNDFKIVANLFDIDHKRMKDIVDDTIYATITALENIQDIQLKKWDKLDISKQFKKYSEISLNFMIKTVNERISLFQDIFSKAMQELAERLNYGFPR